ncbi:iron-sulfur cluster assembly protein [Rhodotorula toruloides]|uniref:Iron-sulfur cluster assembly protein n=1 Tax=Rhodotorula toruloides TaxID=5286 RepID=A0A511KH84_RHOTO|nr:iron-sulfur cluster assembly protein [Rhodotorula toruloides]
MFAAIRTPMLRTAARPALAARAAIPKARLYHEKVIDHYERPRNVGSLDKNDINVGSGLVGAPACGDVMKLMIKVDDKGVISDVKFKTFGCGSAIASSSYMTERVKGLSIEQAAAIKNTEIANASYKSALALLLHCSMLAEDAIKAAIKDYHKKRAAGGKASKPGHIDVSMSAATGKTEAQAHPGSNAV